MAPPSADIERTERLRYNLGDARPPIPRRESLSTVYAYVKQHRHFEAAGIPIIPIAPVSPSPRPRKRPRPNAPIPPLPLPPAADTDPSPMSSQDDYFANPPDPPRLDSVYAMSPSLPRSHLPLLLPAPAKTVSTPPQLGADQLNHHNHFPAAPVFTSASPAGSYGFSSPPMGPAEPYEFVDAFNELYGLPATQSIDWRMTPDSFSALYRGLDAPIANIDRILERNRARLEGGIPAAPKADMWASYPTAVDPFQRDASRSALITNGRAIRGGRRRRRDGNKAFA